MVEGSSGGEEGTFYCMIVPLMRSYSEVIPEKRRRAKHPSPPQALVGKRTPAKGQLSRTDGLSGSPDGSAPYWQPTGRADRWGGGGGQVVVPISLASNICCFVRVVLMDVPSDT